MSIRGIAVTGMVAAWLAASGCSASMFRLFEAPAALDRPHYWAEPVTGVSVPNVYRVSRDVYRGPQPTPQQARELRQLGIRTIVTLRTGPADPALEQAGVASEQIPMRAWVVEDQDVARFLRLATDERHTPVYVHCMTGGDRTGMAVAAYRVAVQGWTRQQALDEMTFGGFGYHPVWDKLSQYVAEFDVNHVRELAGLSDRPLPAPPTTASPGGPQPVAHTGRQDEWRNMP